MFEFYSSTVCITTSFNNTVLNLGSKETHSCNPVLFFLTLSLSAIGYFFVKVDGLDCRQPSLAPFFMGFDLICNELNQHLDKYT